MSSMVTQFSTIESANLQLYQEIDTIDRGIDHLEKQIAAIHYHSAITYLIKDDAGHDDGADDDNGGCIQKEVRKQHK